MGSEKYSSWGTAGQSSLATSRPQRKRVSVAGGRGGPDQHERGEELAEGLWERGNYTVLWSITVIDPAARVSERAGFGVGVRAAARPGLRQ